MSRRSRAIGVVLTGAITVGGGAYLNQRSLDTLAPTTIKMQRVTHCAARISPVKFVVYHGYRTEEEQRSMLARGVSWVNRSRHQDGEAVDVMAVIDGKGTWNAEPYQTIARAFYACGEALKTPITWGGEWRVKDLVHFEVKK